LVFHAHNSTDSPDEEQPRLVIICQCLPTDATISPHILVDLTTK